jgi:hypothetical protein
MLAFSPLSALALALLPLAVVAAPAPQGGGPGVPDSPFMLYAYGDDFGGLPVIYYKGVTYYIGDMRIPLLTPGALLGFAFLGNVSDANDPESAVVICESQTHQLVTMLHSYRLTKIYS